MNRKSRLAPALLAALTLFAACSKGSGPSSGNSAYHLSGSLNGTAWSGNVVVDTPHNLDVIGGLEDNIFVVVAANYGSRDTSIIAVAFKADIALNTAVPCSDPDSVAVVYANTTDQYLGDPPVAGSGTLTVNTIDRTNMVVAGTFSGSLEDQNGLTLSVTGGYFKSYFKNLYTPPTPPGVKDAIKRCFTAHPGLMQ